MRAGFREAARPLVKTFVEGLPGKYRECVSDKFLVALLMDRLMDLAHERETDSVENIAYQAAVVVFEQYMEHGCGIVMNGHHVAQTFCSALKPLEV